MAGSSHTSAHRRDGGARFVGVLDTRDEQGLCAQV